MSSASSSTLADLVDSCENLVWYQGGVATFSSQVVFIDYQRVTASRIPG